MLKLTGICTINKSNPMLICFDGNTKLISKIILTFKLPFNNIFQSFAKHFFWGKEAFVHNGMYK